jgi:hypothetical protein
MQATENLYNSRLGKVRWFAKRFGAGELIRKPLRMLLAPVIVPRLTPRTFQFKGQELHLFYHAYNMTWATERCVEVPVIRHVLEGVPPKDVLEVGNVLSHYGPIQHMIVDKFERGAGIINEDIVTFQPGWAFKLIISISTFEHIGFDDERTGHSKAKILTAVHACRQLLQPGGQLVITVPVGYNPEMDSILAGNELGAEETWYFKQTRKREWMEVGKEEALRARYGSPFPYANSIAVAGMANSAR